MATGWSRDGSSREAKTVKQIRCQMSVVKEKFREAPTVPGRSRKRGMEVERISSVQLCCEPTWEEVMDLPSFVAEVFGCRSWKVVLQSDDDSRPAGVLERQSPPACPIHSLRHDTGGLPLSWRPLAPRILVIFIFKDYPCNSFAALQMRILYRYLDSGQETHHPFASYTYWASSSLPSIKPTAISSSHHSQPRTKPPVL